MAFMIHINFKITFTVHTNHNSQIQRKLKWYSQFIDHQRTNNGLQKTVSTTPPPPPLPCVLCEPMQKVMGSIPNWGMYTKDPKCDHMIASGCLSELTTYCDNCS